MRNREDGSDMDMDDKRIVTHAGVIAISAILALVAIRVFVEKK